MKRVLVIMMLLAFVAASTVAFAADTVTYTGKGTVTFNHKAHGVPGLPQEDERRRRSDQVQRLPQEVSYRGSLLQQKAFPTYCRN